MTNQPPATAAATASTIGSHLRAVGIIGGAIAAGVWLMGRLDQQSGRSYPGRLQARMITIATEQPARLREIQARTGQRVAAGDPLFVLESVGPLTEPHKLREAAARSAQEAQRVQAAAELELHWRRRELQAEMFQTQLKLAALRQEKLHLDVEQVAWHEQLSVQTVFADEDRPPALFRFLSDATPEVSEVRMQAMLKEDAAASAAEAIAAQIALCEQRLVELKSLDQTIQAQIQLSFGVDAAARQHRESAAALNMENTEPLTSTIVSPSYGLLGVFHKQPGDHLNAGEFLVQILDDDRRTIEVEVPSWAAVRFEPGKPIRLEFPGHVKRTGMITAIPPQTSTSIADPAGDASVKLTVSPSGKAWPHLPIGSRVLVYQP